MNHIALDVRFGYSCFISSSERIMLSIIIPAYNEANRIGPTIGKIVDYARSNSLDIELIVVDDGSSDGTADIAQRCDCARIIRLEKNSGKGRAVREGMIAARGDVVMFTDADMSAPIEETDKLSQAIEDGFDVAVGSRMAKPRQIDKFQPVHRMALGLAFGGLVQLVFNTGVRDTQCGFKMFTKRAAKLLASNMTVDGFTFDVEMLALARRMGLSVAEIPVKWHDVSGSKVNVVKHFPRIILELAKTKRRLLRR